MYKRLFLMAALVVAVSGTAVSSTAAAKPVSNPIIIPEPVCSGLDSGKIDVVGNHKTVTAIAPAGKLISGYCVKAGSVNNDNGPVYYTLNTPVATLTFGHPSGKDVSHYSLSYVRMAVTKIGVPVQPDTDDLCGLNNATWIVPQNTSQVSWSITNEGYAVVSTKNGFEFTDGTTSHNYGAAQDNGVGCIEEPGRGSVEIPSLPTSPSPTNMTTPPLTPSSAAITSLPFTSGNNTQALTLVVSIVAVITAVASVMMRNLLKEV